MNQGLKTKYNVVSLVIRGTIFLFSLGAFLLLIVTSYQKPLTFLQVRITLIALISALFFAYLAFFTAKKIISQAILLIFEPKGIRIRNFITGRHDVVLYSDIKEYTIFHSPWELFPFRASKMTTLPVRSKKIEIYGPKNIIVSLPEMNYLNFYQIEQELLSRGIKKQISPSEKFRITRR